MKNKNKNLYSEEEKAIKERFEKVLLNQTVKSIKEDTLVLTNGVALKIFESDSACCASADGSFSWIAKNTDDFQAAITNVEVEITENDSSELETSIKVTMLHNGEGIASLDGFARAKNGYYFSALSLTVHSLSQKKGGGTFTLVEA